MSIDSLGKHLAESLGASSSSSGVSVSFGTVSAIHEYSADVKLDVSMYGGTLYGLSMTTGCRGVSVGDRVIVQTYGHLSVVTGIIAHDNFSTHAACTCISTSSSLSLSANTITTVTWSGYAVRQEVSTDSHFYLESGRLVCCKAGYVLVEGSIYVNGSSGMNYGAYIFLDDVQVAGVYHAENHMSAVTTGARIVPVSAGSIIDLRARASVATTCAPNNAASFLSAMYI